MLITEKNYHIPVTELLNKALLSNIEYKTLCHFNLMKFYVTAMHSATVSQPIERRLSGEKSRKVISSITIENDDKTLSVHCGTLVCQCPQIQWENTREKEAQVTGLTLDLPLQPPAAPLRIIELFIETLPSVVLQTPSCSARVHSITQCTCSVNTHVVTCTYIDAKKDLLIYLLLHAINSTAQNDYPVHTIEGTKISRKISYWLNGYLRECLEGRFKSIVIYLGVSAGMWL